MLYICLNKWKVCCVMCLSYQSYSLITDQRTEHVVHVVTESCQRNNMNTYARNNVPASQRTVLTAASARKSSVETKATFAPDRRSQTNPFFPHPQCRNTAVTHFRRRYRDIFRDKVTDAGCWATRAWTPNFSDWGGGPAFSDGPWPCFGLRAGCARVHAGAQ